jgi:uncharacterized protein (DUF1697 family)
VSRPRYVALLRAITNVPMKPFRRALEELGFTDVESYATSGNLLFNARASDPAALERRIAARVGTAAFVRTRTEMARVVAQDPLGAMIMFLAHPPTAAKRHSFLDLDFQEPSAEVAELREDNKKLLDQLVAVGFDNDELAQALQADQPVTPERLVPTHR